MAQATGIWEQVIGKAPERAYLTFDRLSIAYEKLGTPERFAQLLPASSSPRTRRTGAPGWRWPNTSKRAATPAVLWNCSSRRSSTILTP